jgi:hypothetical protein
MSDGADHASAFRRMADKIDTNRENGFAGAFVIVAPDGSAHSALLLDDAADAAMFWSTIKTRVDIAIGEIEANERQGASPYGRR